MSRTAKNQQVVITLTQEQFNALLNARNSDGIVSFNNLQQEPKKEVNAKTKEPKIMSISELLNDDEFKLNYIKFINKNAHRSSPYVKDLYVYVRGLLENEKLTGVEKDIIDLIDTCTIKNLKNALEGLKKDLIKKCRLEITYKNIQYARKSEFIAYDNQGNFYYLEGEKDQATLKKMSLKDLLGA